MIFSTFKCREKECSLEENVKGVSLLLCLNLLCHLAELTERFLNTKFLSYFQTAQKRNKLRFQGNKDVVPPEHGHTVC